MSASLLILLHLFNMSISASSRDKFLSVWPGLRDELVDYMKGEKMPKDAVDWFRSVSGLELGCRA